MQPSTLVVESLKAHGVDLIFGLDGDHIVYLYDALADAPDIRIVTVKHENTAAIAAEVYGRLAGRPGIVLTTAGPGATNALSGVAGAYAAAAPVIHLCGGVQTGAEKEAFHGVDDPDFLQQAFAPVTKWSTRVEEPAEIAAALDRAFEIALSGRPGPVHVEVPLGVLDVDVELPAPTATVSRLEQAVSAPVPDASVAALAERIERAERIAIVAGKNAWWPLVSEELVALAERLHAPVGHTWDGLGAMPTVHPLSMSQWSASGGGIHPVARRFVEEADLVLAVGVRRETGAWRRLRAVAGDERLAVLDAADEPDGTGAIEAGSVAGLARLLRDLRERCRERPEDPRILDACREAHDALRQGLGREIARHQEARPWHIGMALQALAERMTPETLVVTDVSQVKMWAPFQLPVFNPESQLQSGSWGAMGYVIPGVLAAGLARPDTRVVGLVGDASFLMGSSDFVTICELGLPVVIAIHADRQIGMIHATLTEKFGRVYATEVGEVDFVRYAEAFGARGIRVDEPEQIGAAWDEALASDGPVLLELRAGHAFPRPWPLERLVGAGA
jgi:acetolactate synthase-1/2/3 large subunit